jgi:hypothetical protein
MYMFLLWEPHTSYLVRAPNTFRNKTHLLVSPHDKQKITYPKTFKQQDTLTNIPPKTNKQTKQTNKQNKQTKQTNKTKQNKTNKQNKQNKQTRRSYNLQGSRHTPSQHAPADRAHAGPGRTLLDSGPIFPRPDPNSAFQQYKTGTEQPESGPAFRQYKTGTEQPESGPTFHAHVSTYANLGSDRPEVVPGSKSKPAPGSKTGPGSKPESDFRDSSGSSTDTPDPPGSPAYALLSPEGPLQSVSAHQTPELPKADLRSSGLMYSPQFLQQCLASLRSGGVTSPQQLDFARTLSGPHHPGVHDSSASSYMKQYQGRLQHAVASLLPSLQSQQLARQLANGLDHDESLEGRTPSTQSQASVRRTQPHSHHTPTQSQTPSLQASSRKTAQPPGHEMPANGHASETQSRVQRAPAQPLAQQAYNMPRQGDAAPPHAYNASQQGPDVSTPSSHMQAPVRRPNGNGPPHQGQDRHKTNPGYQPQVPGNNIPKQALPQQIPGYPAGLEDNPAELPGDMYETGDSILQNSVLFSPFADYVNRN